MLDLIAQGSSSDHRWRRSLDGLSSGSTIRLGRVAGAWSADWDDKISREHAEITFNGKSLRVKKLSSARNPIFFKGQKVEVCDVAVGEHFVIGTTSFTVARRPDLSDSNDPSDLTQHAFNVQQLRKNPFRDAGQRIEVLGRLPDLISSSSSDTELWVRVATVLLQGVPSAAAVAIVELGNHSDSDTHVLHYDSRLPTESQRSPSSTLVHKAIESGESVLHLWSGTKNPQFTESEGVDWAFCVPVNSERQGSLGLYVAGANAGMTTASWTQQTAHVADGLQDDLKYTELVATTIANLRNMRSLQQRQAGLQQFFAPVVMNALTDKSAEDALAPREADVSVLFCDLRGFSRQSEKAQDRLLELLKRVSEALGVMTRHILNSGGVIGDFHGDAAMGFWGWPLTQADGPGRACETALAIMEEFTKASDNRSLTDFRCGIGIASGRAVAGRIGTVDQVKVTAFGPVVNLASRLEGMTSQLSAEILIDEATAGFVRTHVSSDACRIRRLARVRPAGIDTPLIVSQVLPPHGPLCSLTDQHIACYEDALDAFLDKRWDESFEKLHEIPASDRSKDFLTVFIAQHGRVAPSDWNGVIELPKH